MKAMTRRRMLALSTPTQHFLQANEACIAGRCRVGAQSLAQYFRTASHADDLKWIASRLGRAQLPEISRYWVYKDRVENAVVYGRWGAQRTRPRLLSLFEEFGIQFPAVLL